MVNLVTLSTLQIMNQAIDDDGTDIIPRLANGDKPSGLDENNREIRIQGVGSFTFDVEQLQQQVQAGQQVWIVSHGWNANYADFAELAGSIKQANPGDIVLTID